MELQQRLQFLATLRRAMHSTGVELPTTNESDEQTLIERAQREPQAFGVLFDRHYPAIFGYVLRRVGKWNDAQDITAEVFLKA